MIRVNYSIIPHNSINTVNKNSIGQIFKMSDIVDKKTRSEMMSGIRGSNTKPELLVRKALFGRGFRYRLHPRDISGKPDLALPKYKAVIFVDGCFWHMHGCDLFKWPKTREEFWRTKLTRNRERDSEVNKLLHERGWRIARIWECALKGRKKRPINEIVDTVEHWLIDDTEFLEIAGE